jgi:hypothetical protein
MSDTSLYRGEGGFTGRGALDDARLRVRTHLGRAGQRRRTSWGINMGDYTSTTPPTPNKDRFDSIGPKERLPPNSSDAQKAVHALKYATSAADAQKYAGEASAEIARLEEQLEAAKAGGAVKPKRKIVRAAVSTDLARNAAKTTLTEKQKLDFSGADPVKWVFKDIISNGSSRSSRTSKEIVTGSIEAGIAQFKADPAKYVSLVYQTDVVDWPEDQQRYTLYYREGTKGLEYTAADDGWMTVIMVEYQALPVIELEAKDAYTDAFHYEGYTLHREKNQPISPGRGGGVADVPSIKIIGDVDPSDISQGGVGGEKQASPQFSSPFSPASEALRLSGHLLLHHSDSCSYVLLPCPQIAGCSPHYPPSLSSTVPSNISSARLLISPSCPRPAPTCTPLPCGI